MHPQPYVKSLIRFINEKWAEEWVAKEFKASCEFRYVFIRTICGQFADNLRTFARAQRICGHSR